MITGGKGFIGTNLVKALITNPDISEIRVFDSGIYGKTMINNPKVLYIDGDIRDKELLLNSTKNISTIFHMAAVISVAESQSDPQLYENVNVIGTLNVLDAAVANGIRHVIFSSSCAVYGDKNGVLRESSMVFNGNSPYAISKLHGEQYCQFYKKTYGLNTTILRYFNVYGKDQDPNRPYASAVSSFLKNLKANLPFIIYGKGTQTRDFVHVTDIVRANIFCMEKSLEGVYNIGTGVSNNINTLAKKMGPIHDVKYTKARSGDIQRVRCDNSKIIGAGFVFEYPVIEDGIKTLL